MVRGAGAARPEECSGEDDDEDKKRRHPGKGFALCGIGSRRLAAVLRAGKLEVGEFYFLDGCMGFRCWLRRSWFGSRDRSGLRRRGSADGRGLAELIGVNLGLAEAGEVVGDRFFVAEAKMLGVGANESFIEDAARKQVEVFFFDGLQHAGADFGDAGDVVERELLGFAGFAEFVAECGHGFTET